MNVNFKKLLHLKNKLESELNNKNAQLDSF